ncbi:hypothetical protein AMAG_19662 [Allomyces macrogynus ATCC 38327]|uniref:Uncharacterized protein n=1 Tax=Allomyces macrogynus (strain ATCC 38327) TaxID=578462 RepID=A0A0L0SXD8_ALLM3|nr:hypothetical protein AMAG_19662 [Allomyces macrogynus ATCC 38327]|eukprot:KNE67172.1 hypothetical protein AMAG_19662 [Allomyces macrogynus ATCC 38327]
MWAAAAAHLPPTSSDSTGEGTHPKPFLAAIQTLARARDAQSASAKSASLRMQSTIRRADEAESACADARRQIDHLADLVARAERARDVAVTDARSARAEAVERVKVADAARRAAQARLKRVLSGVYAARARAAQRDGPGHAAVWAAARHGVRLNVVTGYDDDDGDDELEATATTSTSTSVSSFLDASAAAASSRGGGRTAFASPTKSAAGGNASSAPGLAPSPVARRVRDREPVLPGV